MPTYVYECRKCGHRFEVFHGILDAPRKRCPKCRGAVKRVVSAGGGLIFKGSGFYITDYRSKEYRKQEKQEKQGKAEKQEKQEKQEKPAAAKSGGQGKGSQDSESGAAKKPSKEN
jgi:putative FmdB family regulatory protein